ncbi:MAG: winged helix-turn-helix transcriptional regulator [Firmicutes bacterium]|nr:winged helix-turn-helix transcriptional regulator [Bacillota bacterium]
MPVKKSTPATEGDTCEVFAYDLTRVRRLRRQLHHMEELAEVFAALGDPTRVKIVYALSQEEMCVCDLAALVGLSLQAVSYHLRLLRALRLVKYRRQGRRVFYSLDDEHVVAMVSQGMAHVEHD